MEASRTRADRARQGARPARNLSLIVFALGAAGAALLVVAELSTIVTVELDTGTCEEFADATAKDECDKRGLEQHGGALLLLGPLAIVMAFGASRRRSRPAAAALLLVGAVVVGLVLLRDLPSSNKSGFVTLAYEANEATASAGAGFYLEIAGATLCAAAGALALARRPAD